MEKNTTAITPEEFNRKYTILYRKYQIARKMARIDPCAETLESFYQARKTLEQFIVTSPPLG